MRRTVFHLWMTSTHRLLWAGVAVCLLLSCGMHDQGEVASTGDTGVVTFSVQWMPSGEPEDSDRAQSLAAQPLGAVNCTTYGIGQIQLEVWRFLEGTSTGVGAIRDCSAHAATLSGVPADVPVYVSLTSGDWYGMSSSFTLSSGETHDLGVIEVRDTVPSRWHTAVTLNQMNPFIEQQYVSGGPVVDSDGSGNAIAVWSQGGRMINANHFNRSEGWGTKIPLLETEDFSVGFSPFIAMNDSGDAIAVWKEENGLSANRYTKENGWSGPRLIRDTPNEVLQDFPRHSGQIISLDAHGNAIVVWHERDPDDTTHSIFASRYGATADTWWPATQIENSVLSSRNPQIVMDDSGNAMVLFEQFEEPIFHLYACRYTASTDTWWPATPIENSMLSGMYPPQIVMDDSGNAIVMWKQEDGTLNNIVARGYTASTDSWGPETHLEDQKGYLSASSWKIAMDGSGNAIAVWVEYDIQGEEHNDFYENRYTPSDGWEGERFVTYIFYDTVLDLEIAMDDTGTAILGWSQWVDNENTHIYAKRYTWSTDTWDPETLIEDTDPGHANYLRMTMDGRGNAVAVWEYVNPDWISFPYANHYD